MPNSQRLFLLDLVTHTGPGATELEPVGYRNMLFGTFFQSCETGHTYYLTFDNDVIWHHPSDHTKCRVLKASEKAALKTQKCRQLETQITFKPARQ